MTLRKSIFVPCTLLFAIFHCQDATAQKTKLLVRLARIEIDSANITEYKSLLKEEIEASIRLEPGVLTLNAVAEKENPTHITILEVYADSSAYQSHLQTPHFKKYKTGTQHMVKSLELVPTDPVMLGMKPDVTKRLKR
jgi:4-carboxymuconolactone decarboxylase